MSKRKIISGIVIAAVVLLAGWLGWNVLTQAQAKAEREALTATLPDFIFQSIDGHVYTKADLKADKKRVLLFFSPGCDHCQYEARQIHSYLPELTKAEILWIGPNMQEQIKAFAQEYGLDTLPGNHILYDNRLQMDTIFGTKGFPEIWIYDEQGALVKRYQGEAKWEAIIKYI